MTKLLLRLFVKNAQQTDNPAVRASYGKLAGLVGIVCNILLFGAKLLIGTVSGSISITADAVNNLSDASGSVVTLVGFRLASRPADKDHPYGHARMEYLSGLIVSALILLIGFELVKSSVDKILHPEPVIFSGALVLVLVLSIAVKLWMALFNTKLGRKIDSQTLIATAADSRNDVISTAAVLVACLIAKWTGLMIDGYVGLLVALFILWSGIGIAKDTIDPLLGMAPDEELVHAVAYQIRAHEEVLGLHDLIVHDYGPGRRFASVHVEVDYRMDPLIAHEMIDSIEREVQKELHIELVIHYDPIITDNQELSRLRDRVHQILHTIDPNINFHDFRMVEGQHDENVIFDLVLPEENTYDRDAIRTTIENGLSTPEKTYHAVITFDQASFNDPHTTREL